MRELEGFVHTLARNDHTVRSFNASLAQVSQMLKGERGDLAASLHNLGIAMRQVSGFVKDNREILGKNITGLDRITQILVKQRVALAETLRDAPLALNNLALTYNPQAGTLDTRANLGELGHQIQSDPATFLCGHPRPGQPGRTGVQRRPADPGQEPARCAHPPRAARRRTTGSTRASPDSWRPADDPPAEGPRRPGRRRAAADRLLVRRLPAPAARAAPTSGSDPITVTAQFRDVLDLVPDSTVKVNDVTVGKITDISLEGYTAQVTMQLRNDTRLPDNAVATIQQTSLLGEKFVQLAAPDAGASPNPLKSGDIIPIAHTGQNPEVEQVLGALSLLLNGGGVGQLQTITRELDRTLHGREGEARSVLHQIRSFAGQLDRHKQRHRPGAPGARPAVAVAEHAALDHRRHARRAARCAAVDQHPAARPGPDARRRSRT